MYRFLLLALLSCSLAPTADAALAPGDIAILSYTTTGVDMFSFVTLVDIPAGLTEVKFTDRGWLASGGFLSGEGTAIWTAPNSGVLAGTVVTWTAGTGFSVGLTSTAGGEPSFSVDGDQVLVYQGLDSSPTMLFAINVHYDWGWNADASSTSTSALPDGLIPYVTAIALEGPPPALVIPSLDWLYDGTVSTTGTKRELLQDIANDNNWLASGTPASSFTVETTGTITQSVFNGAGWRMLSAPVGGVIVDDLAAMNLVQGIPAGGSSPAQYPLAGANLLSDYDGTSFNAPFNTDSAIEPGRGLIWNLYDVDITPDPGAFGGGTSVSHELSSFMLSATGPLETSDVTQNFNVTGDDFYLLGNPFPDVLAVSGITSALNPIQGGLIQIYNPNGPTYEPLEAYNGEGSDYVAAWQGFFAEVAFPFARGAGGLQNQVTYDFESTEPGYSSSFYGKSGSVAASRISFELTGTTTGGTDVTDRAAIVRFREGAIDGWDIHDASKLTPPTSTYALVSPMTDRDGAAYRTSVNSLPENPIEQIAVPIAFKATDNGAYELSWTAPLASDWRAELRDVVSGSVVDLASTSSYAFEANATDWANRFELVITASGVVANEETGASEFALGLPQPNPATGNTALSLKVATVENVTATVYDALGRSVGVVLDGEVAPGSETKISLGDLNLAPGVYVVRVSGDTFAVSRRVTIIR